MGAGADAGDATTVGVGAGAGSGAGEGMGSGGGMNLADIGAGLAASIALFALCCVTAGGSSSGITSDAWWPAEAVSDGASAIGSLTVRSIGTDASDSFGSVDGAPIM